MRCAAGRAHAFSPTHSLTPAHAHAHASSRPRRVDDRHSTATATDTTSADTNQESGSTNVHRAHVANIGLAAERKGFRHTAQRNVKPLSTTLHHKRLKLRRCNIFYREEADYCCTEGKAAVQGPHRPGADRVEDD